MHILASNLHSEVASEAMQEPFIKAIQSAAGSIPDDIIYVRTGGTEGLFKEQFFSGGRLSIPEPVRLLTSGKSNSLAASMEILSFLRQHGCKGEILHGSPEYIAGRILHPAELPSGENLLTEVSAGKILAGERLGVVGRPSDWLISSDVDSARALEVLGLSLVDIPMKELLSGFGKHSHPEVTLPPLNEPRYGKSIPSEDLSDALDLYGALRDIISKEKLGGLTIRCFDLLTAVHNTGCMALALLNSEGFTATCEGDVPAMISMAIARKLTGCPGFQANLSQISGDGDLLFAHCTVPLSMTRSWVYDTHFESGFGVAVHGEIPEGPVTIFKLSPDFRRAFIFEGEICANDYQNNLCRTQVHITAPGAAPYFLSSPIGNHHVIIPGHVAGCLRALLNAD